MAERGERARQLVEGHIGRSVWFLAWPVVIQSLLQVLIGTVDLKMVGYLGSEAIAAVGISRQIIMIIMILILAVSTGATAMVARYCGRGEEDRAGQVAAQALILCFLFSVVMIPAGLLSSEWMLVVLGAQPEVIELGLSYMNVFFLGVFFFLGNFMVKAILHGAGDTKTPLIIQVLVNIVNIVGNYLLIFGVAFFPTLGVMGAAVASALSRLVGMVLGLIVLLNDRYGLALSLKAFFRFRLLEMKQILKIGTPAALQGLARNISTIILVGMIARTASQPAAVSAFSIGTKITQYSLMPGLAVGTAATTLVGMSLGASDVSRAEESGWAATRIGVIIMTIFALVSFIFAPQIVRFFVQDESVIEIGTWFIRIIALAEPFHAIGIVLAKGLQGAGDTRPPFYITVISWLVVRTPLAYFLAFVLDLQSTGIWLAISLSVVLQGILMVIKFKEGSWKQIKVVTSSSQ